ncbi:MAG TPA: phosphotransferase [Streptosporangiaceae bacterium]|nr:phosphotransferase [Streptosporangiaceae bacterium]
MIIITDTYSQPDAPDPILADDRVLELARRHAGSLLKVTFVDESGGEARAYMCDDDLVFKTQRPQQLRPRTSLEKEAFILGQLAAQDDLPVPRVVGYGREDDVEYLLMTRIPGVCLESTSLFGAARVAVLAELGATLRRVHDVDQSAMETSALIPGDASAGGLHDRISALFDQLIASLAADPRWAAEIDLRAVADQALASLPAGTLPVTLHSNPGPEHCFVDPGTGRFTGLIDFGDAYRSHSALDVRSWRSPEDSRHMLSGYRALGPLPEGFEHVWRTGIIITQLRLAARGHREPDKAARTIHELLNG